MNYYYSQKGLNDLEISKEDFGGASARFAKYCPADLSEVIKAGKKFKNETNLGNRLVQASTGIQRSELVSYSHLLTSERLEDFDQDTTMNTLEDATEELRNMADQITTMRAGIEDSEGAAGGVGQEDNLSDLDLSIDGGQPFGVGVVYKEGAKMQHRGYNVSNMIPIVAMGDKRATLPYTKINVLNDYLEERLKLASVPTTFMDMPPATIHRIVTNGAAKYLQYMTTGLCPPAFNISEYEYHFYVYQVLMTAIRCLEEQTHAYLDTMDEKEGEEYDKYSALNAEIAEFTRKYENITIDADIHTSMPTSKLIWTYLTAVQAAAFDQEDKDQTRAMEACDRKVDALIERVNALYGIVQKNDSKNETFWSKQLIHAEKDVALFEKISGTIGNLEQMINSLTTQVTTLSKFVSSKNYMAQTPTQVGDYKMPTAPKAKTLEDELKEAIDRMAQEIQSISLDKPELISDNPSGFRAVRRKLTKNEQAENWTNVLAVGGCFGVWPKAFLKDLPRFEPVYQKMKANNIPVSEVIKQYGISTGIQSSLTPAPIVITPSGTRVTNAITW